MVSSADLNTSFSLIPNSSSKSRAVASGVLF